MSLCDTCTKPGACCRSFRIYTNELGMEGAPRIASEAAVRALAGANRFKVALYDGAGYPIWECDALTPEGRCATYKRRPELCKRFQEGIEDTCVMTKPKEPAGAA